MLFLALLTFKQEKKTSLTSGWSTQLVPALRFVLTDPAASVCALFPAHGRHLWVRGSRLHPSLLAPGTELLGSTLRNSDWLHPPSAAHLAPWPRGVSVVVVGEGVFTAQESRV